MRIGRHVCRDDGADFGDLERYEDEYKVIFESLGYELVHHDQGFYYLKGDDQLSSRRLQAITLFVLILFQELEDRKYENSSGMWEQDLTTTSFSIDSLPHFAIPRRRQMMKRVGVSDNETLKEKVLRPMKSLGIIEDGSNDTFRFRAPVYRFVDICLEVSEREAVVMNEDSSPPHQIEGGGMNGLQNQDAGELPDGGS